MSFLDLPDKVCLVPKPSLSELAYVADLVRALCARAAEVMLVTRREHVGVVRRLFADVPELRFTPVDGWGDVFAGGDGGAAGRLEARGYRVVPLPSYREVCPYLAVGAPRPPAGLRATRDSDAERGLLERVRRLTGPGPYVVVHDDHGRRVRRDLVPEGRAVVRTDDPRLRVDNVLDWMQAVDNAEQLHAVDSCVLMLADLLGLRPVKHCHAYASGAGYRPGTHSDDVVVVWG